MYDQGTVLLCCRYVAVFSYQTILTSTTILFLSLSPSRLSRNLKLGVNPAPPPPPANVMYLRQQEKRQSSHGAPSVKLFPIRATVTHTMSRDISGWHIPSRKPRSFVVCCCPGQATTDLVRGKPLEL